MKKTKFYKNPDRAQTRAPKPYVPVYQLEGIKPSEMAAGHIAAAKKQLTRHAPVVSNENPRVRPAPTFQVNVPFATSADVLPKAATIPNVGNNMENSWTAVDNFDEYVETSSFEDESVVIDPNNPLIDNNFEDEENWKPIPKVLRKAPEAVDMSDLDSDDEFEEVQDTYDTQAQSPMHSINDDDYVIIIDGQIIRIGKLVVVQDEVRDLIFGDHELNKIKNITEDDIVVLKRVKIKVGVFLE